MKEACPKLSPEEEINQEIALQNDTNWQIFHSKLLFRLNFFVFWNWLSYIPGWPHATVEPRMTMNFRPSCFHAGVPRLQSCEEESRGLRPMEHGLRGSQASALPTELQLSLPPPQSVCVRASNMNSQNPEQKCPLQEGTVNKRCLWRLGEGGGCGSYAFFIFLEWTGVLYTKKYLHVATPIISNSDCICVVRNSSDTQSFYLQYFFKANRS